MTARHPVVRRGRFFSRPCQAFAIHCNAIGLPISAKTTCESIRHVDVVCSSAVTNRFCCRREVFVGDLFMADLSDEFAAAEQLADDVHQESLSSLACFNECAQLVVPSFPACTQSLKAGCKPRRNPPPFLPPNWFMMPANPVAAFAFDTHKQTRYLRSAPIH